MRTLLPRTIVIGALVAVSPSVQAQPPAARTTAEYPLADSQEASFIERARLESRLAGWLADDPFHPEGLDSLFREPFLRQTMKQFSRLPDEPPARIAAVLESLWRDINEVAMNEHRGYTEIVRATLARLRSRLATFPRETEARIAERMLRIDHQLTPGPGGSDEALLASLKRFIADYRGTEASLVAEVDFIRDQQLELPAMVTRLEQFIRDHPGTVAAAEALSCLGYAIATSDTWGGPPADTRGANHPVLRLRRVVELIGDLESGRYPGVKWSAGAGLLDSTGRLVGPAVPLAPSDATDMFDLYRASLRAHVAGPFAWPPERLTEFVVHRMGPLFARQGDRIAGIEATLGELETLMDDPSRIRLLRAEFYARESFNASPARATLAEKAARTFELVANESANAPGRKALATLVMDGLRAGDHNAARSASEKYLARHPYGAWAWRAAITLGDARHALGDSAGAAAAYQHEAIASAADPVVRAIAGVRAGRALDRIGYFDEALDTYRRALSAADAARLSPFSSAWGRAAVVKRIAELERSRLEPQGNILEAARLAVPRGPNAEARKHLEAFLAPAPTTAAATEARELLHRILLGEALTLATPGNPNRNDDAAMAVLDRLAGAPHDFAVGVAGIARAALLMKAGRVEDARTAMTAALDGLTTAERGDAPSDSAATIASDAAAIEAVLSRPLREIEGISPFSRLATSTWPTPALVTRLDRRVVLATGEETMTRIRRNYPDARWVLHLTYDEYNLLTRVIDTAGRNRARTAIPMIGGPVEPDEGPPFWDRFFPPSDRPTRPMCDACPSVGSIEFLDEERTAAIVSVGITGGGTTWLVMRKTDGIWRVVRQARISSIS